MIVQNISDDRKTTDLTCTVPSDESIRAKELMEGLSSNLSYKDFFEVLKKPRNLIVALICQMIMLPLIGIIIISLFPIGPSIFSTVIPKLTRVLLNSPLEEYVTNTP